MCVGGAWAWGRCASLRAVTLVPPRPGQCAGWHGRRRVSAGVDSSCSGTTTLNRAGWLMHVARWLSNVDTFFQASLDLNQKYPTPKVLQDAQAAGATLAVSQLQAAFGGPSKVALSCKGSTLNMVSLCLSKDMTAQVNCKLLVVAVCLALLNATCHALAREGFCRRIVPRLPQSARLPCYRAQPPTPLCAPHRGGACGVLLVRHADAGLVAVYLILGGHNALYPGPPSTLQSSYDNGCVTSGVTQLQVAYKCS